MSLGSEDWRRINGCLVRLYRELDRENQNRLMLELLGELIEFDTANLNSFAPPDELSIRSFPQGFFVGERTKAIERHFLQSAFGNCYPAIRAGRGPLKCCYQCCGILAVIDGAVHAVLIHREKRPFGEFELDTLNAILPHLSNSYINALVHTRAKNSVMQISLFQPLPQLRERKNEVLRWMMEGKRNSEIAAIMHISPRTVEKHVAEILDVLGVENRASAILKMVEFCAVPNQTHLGPQLKSWSRQTI